MSMIVNGFIEPIAKELPLEYAVELNRLIQLEMEGSVGINRWSWERSETQRTFALGPLPCS